MNLQSPKLIYRSSRARVTDYLCNEEETGKSRTQRSKMDEMKENGGNGGLNKLIDSRRRGIENANENEYIFEDS